MAGSEGPTRGWLIGGLIAVASVGGLIYLAASAGYTPPGADTDQAMREAMQDIEQATADSEHVDFADLPADLSSAEPGSLTAFLFRGFDACGSIDLASFEADWRGPADDGEWADPRVFDGRLQAGGLLRLEYCPVHIYERSAGRVLTVAVWHEDVHDPGDATLVYVELARTNAGLAVRCSFDRDHLELGWQVVLTERT